MDNFNDINRPEWIDRYVRGNLDEPEQQLFQAQMQQDESLRQEVEDIRIAQSLLRHYGLRNEIKAVRAAMKQEEKDKAITANEAPASPISAETKPVIDNERSSSGRSITMYPWTGRIAASLVLLIVGFLAIQFATLSPEQLYEEKMRSEAPYLGLSNRSMEDREDTIADQVRTQYQFGNYDEVIRLYGELESPTFAETFYLGYAYLQTEETDQAIASFQKVIDDPHAFMIKDKAEYYLALSYLQDGQVDPAASILERIHSNQDHDYEDSLGNLYLWRLRLLKMKY